MTHEPLSDYTQQRGHLAQISRAKTPESSKGNCMPVSNPEPFVDAQRAADFLSIEPRHLLKLARKGEIPAYPLGEQRKTWRFRLSDLAGAMEARLHSERQFPAPERIC